MPAGFGSEFQSESVVGALPVGRNSPQRPPLGLYAEQLSGTAFTAPRHENRRSWLYRRMPSAAHEAFRPLAHGGLAAPPFADGVLTPNRLRWDPLPLPSHAVDWLDGLHTLAGNGSAEEGAGVSVHLYACNASMTGRAFCSADGEMLFVPQAGALTLVTEFGVMRISPGHVALVPRGVKFRVDVDGPSRGYVLENHGALFRLPDLGPIGANGLANPRDFETPEAATEADALEVARALARNNLFKCAVFGNDPNWGRVLAAVGTTRAAFDPHLLDVTMNGIEVCRAGGVGADRSLVDLSAREVRVVVELHAGAATATVWTNDLTHDYVHENSAYST